MNPLPPDWLDHVAARPDANAFVLVDTAMQHELGAKLVRAPGDALPLSPDLPGNAAALSAWIMPAETALSHGVDGSARGVNWISTTSLLADARDRLRRWAFTPLPDGAQRGYLRIADGRVLPALMQVWTPPQRAAFLAPWLAWCHADRDGRGVMLSIEHDASDEPKGVSPHLGERQYQRLLDESIPDQLLHALKSVVQPHPSLASRHSRYCVAASLVDKANEFGITDPQDWMALIAWSLQAGYPALQQVFVQPAVRAGRRGTALWDELMSAPAGAR